MTLDLHSIKRLSERPLETLLTFPVSKSTTGDDLTSRDQPLLIS